MGEVWGNWGEIGGIWGNRETEKGQNRPPKRSMGELPPKSHPKPDPRPTFLRRLEQLGPAEPGHGAVQAGIDPDLGGRGGSGGPSEPPKCRPTPPAPHGPGGPAATRIWCRRRRNRRGSGRRRNPWGGTRGWVGGVWGSQGHLGGAASLVPFLGGGTWGSWADLWDSGGKIEGRIGVLELGSPMGMRGELGGLSCGVLAGP